MGMAYSSYLNARRHEYNFKNRNYCNRRLQNSQINNIYEKHSNCININEINEINEINNLKEPLPQISKKNNLNINKIGYKNNKSIILPSIK